MFEVPPGSPPVNYFTQKPVHVTVETNHPVVQDLDFDLRLSPDERFTWQISYDVFAMRLACVDDFRGASFEMKRSVQAMNGSAGRSHRISARISAELELSRSCI